jgi:hypothetical protein
MMPTNEKRLRIVSVDYESHYQEQEFEKLWSEGEGKCGKAWKDGVQAIYGSDLEVADAGLVPMSKDALPRRARDRKSVLSTPVSWREVPVGVLNFDSGFAAKETKIHEDGIRECFLMAATRLADLLHGRR